MKLGILSDIHEHPDELRRCIEVLKQNQAERFIVLGDVCETGKRMEETVALLREVAAVGVWGNHDLGFCLDPEPEFHARYSPEVLEFMGTLRPRLEIEGCLFTHVEPWQDTNKMEDIWYFDGPPDTPEKLARSFAAVPNRVMFTGHFHQWLIGSSAGLLPWIGNQPIQIDRTQQHLIVVNAVYGGHCAIFDTNHYELTPFRVESQSELVKSSK